MNASGPAAPGGEVPETGMLGRLAKGLATRGWMVATAESCTGGLVAKLLTDVPGASRYFRGGVVAYDNEIKADVLEVPRKDLERHGAVSEAVALAMAGGVKRRLGSDVGLAVTGIAGPDGGTGEKPVGMVCIALAHPGGALARTCHFGGSRDEVRQASAQAVLTLLQQLIDGE